MKTVRLFEKIKNGNTWFSLNDRCGDWVEIIGEHEYIIPEGFVVCEDRTGELHFYVEGFSSDYAELGTDENGFPYLYGMLHNANERVYLKRPDSNADQQKKEN